MIYICSLRRRSIPDSINMMNVESGDEMHHTICESRHDTYFQSVCVNGVVHIFPDMFRNNFYGGRCEGRIQPLRCCLSKSLFLLIVSILLSGLSTLLERGQPEARLECCLATLSPMSMVLDVGDETKKGKEKRAISLKPHVHFVSSTTCSETVNLNSTGYFLHGNWLLERSVMIAVKMMSNRLGDDGTTTTVPPPSYTNSKRAESIDLFSNINTQFCSRENTGTVQTK